MKLRRHNHHSNQDRWLVSYADFITLLFAFFVVLYASSRADVRKQAEAAQSIHSAFTALGIFPPNGQGKGAGSVAVPPAGKEPVTVQEDLAHIKNELARKFSSEIAARTIALHLGPKGLVISLREAGFYHSGSPKPRRASVPVIARIAAELRPTPYALRIEGHTDNVPIHTARYHSNWELSTARATYLTQLFITRFHLQPVRLSAAGYAQYHPIASNATAAGRAKNRRVDIIVRPHGYVAQPPLSKSATSLAIAPQSHISPPASGPQKPSATALFKLSAAQKPSPDTPSAVASSKAQRPSPAR